MYTPRRLIPVWKGKLWWEEIINWTIWQSKSKFQECEGSICCWYFDPFPGIPVEGNQVAAMGWSKAIRFSEVGDACLLQLGWNSRKSHKGILKIYHIRQQIGFSQPCKITCEGYEAGKIRDDLLHRGTIKPRGGGWRKSGRCPRWLSNILLNTFLNLFMFQVNKIFDQPGRECTVP